MKIAAPCSSCGEPSKSRLCAECSSTNDRRKIRLRSSQPKESATARGYDSRWRRLSERARRLQNFCSDCQATDDLQADHSPEAWERYEAGLPLRLKDIDVLCGPCNRKRGKARGATRDSKQRSHPNDIDLPTEAGKP